MRSVYSNTVSGNASYPLQPPVKRKNNPMGKRNLFIGGDSHINRIERNLIVYHLSDKNISIKWRSFEGADVWRRIQHHLLRSLQKDQINSIIIQRGTNNIAHKKLHTIQSEDLARKIINISKVCKSFGTAKITISSVLSSKDLNLKKQVAET